ncbi:hypothetical protein BT69DRAFT_1283369 [Atractiella rhizophila]|nr:hypothetical protein BT69DRAFT_1283369 [Atractiella rhizophila]
MPRQGITQIQQFNVFPTSKFNLPLVLSKIRLHALDLISVPVHISLHRFFAPLPSNVSFDEVVLNLKRSLAEALELYPPVSGIVRVDEDGETYIVIDRDSTPGTPFLVEEKDVPFTGDNDDVSPRPILVLPPESSTFAVKVTSFSCGTIAVASSLHHQVADLNGCLDFLELWASTARGEAPNLTTVPKNWLHDVERYFPGVPSEIPAETPPPGFTLLDSLPGFSLPPTSITKWKIPKSNLEQLKKDLSPNSGEDWISSGDALATLIWGAIARARHNGKVAKANPSSTETLISASNLRDRFPPDLAREPYFGNCNPLFATTVPRSHLLSPTHECASLIAVEIRKALNTQMSPKALIHKMSFLEAARRCNPPRTAVFVGDVIMTNWSRFNLQGPKLDFGWGTPFETTSGGGVLPPGFSRIQADGDKGDLNFILTVEQEGAEHLEADIFLQRYAKKSAY